MSDELASWDLGALGRPMASSSSACFMARRVVKVSEGAVWTEDMNLLYYYRNRLTGYGLSLLAEAGGTKRERRTV